MDEDTNEQVVNNDNTLQVQELPMVSYSKTKSEAGFTSEQINIIVKGFELKECLNGLRVVKDMFSLNKRKPCKVTDGTKNPKN